MFTVHKTTFVCDECKQEIVHESTISTGYGTDSDGRKVCFACCGEADKQYMRDHDKITLYLSSTELCVDKFVKNWPGTLIIPVTGFSRGCHNFARYRYDVWFRFEGQDWHGVQYGDNTQLVHCKKLKG